MMDNVIPFRTGPAKNHGGFNKFDDSVDRAKAALAEQGVSNLSIVCVNVMRGETIKMNGKVLDLKLVGQYVSKNKRYLPALLQSYNDNGDKMRDLVQTVVRGLAFRLLDLDQHFDNVNDLVKWATVQL